MNNNKTTIYLVRHGQTEWNVEHKLQGHQDSPLTKLGINQAQWLGESIQSEQIDIIYSSSSFRAYRTAELIRGTKEIDIIESNELKEINLGIWKISRGSERNISGPIFTIFGMIRRSLKYRVARLFMMFPNEQ